MAWYRPDLYHRVLSYSGTYVNQQWPSSEQTPHGAWDESMVDGIYNQSYQVPNFLVETVDTPLPIPVYFIGVGEKLEDLQTFNAREFAQALLS